MTSHVRLINLHHVCKKSTSRKCQQVFQWIGPLVYQSETHLDICSSAIYREHNHIVITHRRAAHCQQHLIPSKESVVENACFPSRQPPHRFMFLEKILALLYLVKRNLAPRGRYISLAQVTLRDRSPPRKWVPCPYLHASPVVSPCHLCFARQTSARS